MFLDEVHPIELGFTQIEWGKLSLFEKRVSVAFFSRRTPIATARALGVKDSGISTVRRKIDILCLVSRFAKVKQVQAPQQPCQLEE